LRERYTTIDPPAWSSSRSGICRAIASDMRRPAWMRTSASGRGTSRPVARG
jgi:hypothetical protein